MNKSPELIELCAAIEKWAGKPISGPKDFLALSMKIWNETHSQISISTLERVWGYVEGTQKAHRASLDILARCLGYTGYADFTKQLSQTQKPTSEYITNSTIRTEDLTMGAKIRLAWLPNRVVIIKFHGNLQFEVVESHNSKLKVGDTFQCAYFIENQPLYIDKLCQNDARPVSYVLGKSGGLTEVTLLAD